jgi:hypothetical protein
VEGRLKGAGMRWAREHVNAMVALRTVVYSDRWDEEWAEIGSGLREREREERKRRSQQRRASRVEQEAEVWTVARVKTTGQRQALTHEGAERGHGTAKASGPRRPAADHPWKRAWSTRRQAEQVSAT